MSKKTIVFHKYQGTGNDFIMIDNRVSAFVMPPELIAHLCHRRFGIGADGLIMVEPKQGYDFAMLYFNANGYEGSMCGNGGRCAVKFAQSLGIFDQKTHFWAIDGTHEAFVQNDIVHLKMQDLHSIDIEQAPDFCFLNTGSPHYVAWVNDVSHFDVTTEGKAIRYNQRFATEGTNVNFIEQLSPNTLQVRTYERGVEVETYSCGTGVTAAALVAYKQRGMPSPINIQTLGGELQVSFEIKEQTFHNIFLVGKAEKVFEGSFVANF